MKRALFLFFFVLMLGIHTREVAADTIGTPDYPCLAVIDYDVNTDLNYDCSYWKIRPVNNPYVSYRMENGYVVSIKISGGSLELMANRTDHFDLQVIVEEGGGTKRTAFFRFVFTN